MNNIPKNNDMYERYAVELGIYCIQKNLIPKENNNLVFFLILFRLTNKLNKFNY